MAQRRFMHVFPRGHIECSNVHAWCQEMAVIRLQDAWARFCRELVLTSASDQPMTAAGTPLPRAPGIVVRSDAINALRRVYSRPPGEPKWFDAQASLRAATILGVHNYASISSGIGVTPSPLDDLRSLRNFLAHRGELTAAGVRSIASRLQLAGRANVLSILLSPSSSSGMTILELWVKQLQAMSLVAVR